MTTIEAPKTTPKEVTTADVLERAADLLEEFGWAQGHLNISFVKPGPFCMGTAIQEAARDLAPDRHTELVDAIYQPGERAAFGFDGQVATWNDCLGRTKSEVVSLLRQAAERSRETA